MSKKYNLLISQFSDPVYDNEVIYYLGYLDYVDGKYDDALLRFNSLPDEQKYKSSVPFYKMQMLYAKGDIKQTLKLINTPGFIDNFTKPEQKEEMIRIKANVWPILEIICKPSNCISNISMQLIILSQ